MGLNGFPSSLWQVRRQAGRQTGALTLPKKGSSSAKPEELGQEQARTVSPPSHPPPPRRESWQCWGWLSSTDLRPRLGPETAWCFRLGPGGAAMGSNPQSSGCTTQRDRAWPPALRHSRLSRAAAEVGL